MFLKLLSPVSILVGVVLGLAVVIILWPVDARGPPLALMAFCIGAGGWELGRRIIRPKPATPPSDGAPGTEEPQ